MRGLTLRSPAFIAAKAVPVEFISSWQNTGWVGWHPGGSSETLSVTSLTGRAIGDTVIATWTCDRNQSSGWTTPSGWNHFRHDWQDGGWSQRVYWKRLAVSGDLSSDVTFTNMPEHDFDAMLTCWRGLDPTTPISAVARNQFGSAGGNDPSVTVGRAGSHLLEIFQDWDNDVNDPNWAGSPSGVTKIAYSTNIRWEASQGLYRKGPVGTGSQTMGLPSYNAPGGPNIRTLMALQPAA